MTAQTNVYADLPSMQDDMPTFQYLFTIIHKMLVLITRVHLLMVGYFVVYGLIFMLSNTHYLSRYDFDK